MGKRIERLLGDLSLSSRNPELEQMFGSLSDASNRRAEAENKHRELEKKVADLLLIDVIWSDQERHWYLADKLSGSDAEDTSIGRFSPLQDPAVAITLLRTAHLSTESTLGSFVVAGTTRSGRRVSGRTTSNDIIEVICQVAVDMQE
jgi:hypothetical protein